MPGPASRSPFLFDMGPAQSDSGVEPRPPARRRRGCRTGMTSVHPLWLHLDKDSAIAGASPPLEPHGAEALKLYGGERVGNSVTVVEERDISPGMRCSDTV